MKQDAQLVTKYQAKNINMNKDEYYMSIALMEARKASSLDEVPVGAIIVKNDTIIASSHNSRVLDHKVSSHAEINAIIEAEKKLNTIILDGSTIYTTLEPCPMCSYAIMEAHIERLVYGAKDEKRGGISVLDIFNKKLGPKIEICGNILEEESSNLLKSFFKEKR